MRPRTEALVGLGALGLLAVLAAALGRQRNTDRQADVRASSFVTSPYGTRGLADALMELGLDVRRHRQGARRLPLSDDTARVVFAVIDPTFGLGSMEAVRVVAWQEDPEGGDLLLAGRRAGPLMRCYGIEVDWRGFDSLAIASPAGGTWPKVSGVLASHSEAEVTDSSRLEDAALTTCVVPAVAEAETLLVTASGRVAALRLHLAESRRSVTILSDASLLDNRALRETDAGPFALGLFLGRYDRVYFEETGHGYGAGGSLAGALLTWSRQSPLGWAAWQAGIVGLLALLAGAVRFGPVRPALTRRRRSPLEHVRALATALAAARGHDVAIAAMLRGLRRRLNPAARLRGDLGPWLRQLAGHARTPRERELTQTLETLTRPGQSADGVLRAANAVEDMWEELRP